MSKFEIHGTVADGFEAVREEFAAAVAAEDGESGAQLAAYAGDRKVVDLWAGDGVTGDTLTGVYSSTKGAATLVMALLVQDGVLTWTSRSPAIGRISPSQARARSRCGTCCRTGPE